MGTHTYERTFNCDVVRGLVNGGVADLPEKIGDVERTATPNTAVNESPELQMDGFTDELDRLDAADERHWALS